MSYNPHAIYVHCDGAMDYDKNNFGGIGIVIKFPEQVKLEDISISFGRYKGGNIERIEMEALTEAMKEVMKVFSNHTNTLKNIRQIIFITDRFGLCDTERTNPYQIKSWRSNRWKNHEGKPIKNHESIDRLDKTRSKLSILTRSRISIEYKRRRENKEADKLAKKGKNEGLINSSLAKKLEKIGKRKFDGGEAIYKLFKHKDSITIHIFRKDPVNVGWEVSAELCEGPQFGKKLKIYVDEITAHKLSRRNEYIVKINEVNRFHLTIFKTIKHLPSKT